MKVHELRDKADVLELEIKRIVNDFINEHGYCEIDIRVNTLYEKSKMGEKLFLTSDVKVNLTI